MSNIVINKNNWNLIVDLNGGRIVELSYKDQKILGTFNRIDGKSGNTHVCVPNFAAEGMEKYGWLFHGPFRNIEWTNLGDGSIMAESLGLRVEQKFSFEDEKFRHQIKIKNEGKESMPINLAIHNYWDCEFGWEDLKLNEKNMSNEVKISDDVELKEINQIEITGKEMIFWKTGGFKYAKLWTGFKEENSNKTYDQKYVCIEPVWEKEGSVDLGLKMIAPKEETNSFQEIYFK